MNSKTLIVVVGPTGVGKTDLSIQLAQFFACPIISADSRQIYKELKIGTAPPDAAQLQKVPHYFIGTKSIVEPYSAGQYELDVIDLLDELFKQHSVVLLVGGSMMYIDAVCNGLDNIPTVSAQVRKEVIDLYEKGGLEAVQQKLKQLDPLHYQKVDLKNKQRVMHAVEVSLMLGSPYSQLLKTATKKRTFYSLKIGVNLPRELLYNRINLRVDAMIENGLIEEAKALHPFKHYNSLNTVGYKELFNYFDEKCSLEFAIQMIKQNSRRYAKRQLTWFNADKEIEWFNPNQFEELIDYIKKEISN